VDLYVNGLRFAQGHLIVTDDGEWAFQCDTVGGRAVPDTPPWETPAVDMLDDVSTTSFDDAPEVVAADEALESLVEEGADEPPEADVADEAGVAEEAVDVEETVEAEPANDIDETPNEEEGA
jgi:hypothetical protein